MAQKILKKRSYINFGGSFDPENPTFLSGIKLGNNIDLESDFIFIYPLGAATNQTDASRSQDVPAKKTGTNGISGNFLLSNIIRIREDPIGGSGLAKVLFASSNGLSLLKDDNSFTTTSGKLAVTALNTGKFPDNLFSTAKIDDLAVTNSKIQDSILDFSKLSSIFGVGLTRYDHLGVTNGALKLDLSILSIKITFTNAQWATSGDNKVLNIYSGVHGYGTNFSCRHIVKYDGTLEKINTSATVEIDSTYGDIIVTVPSGSEFSGYIICQRN